MFLTSSCVSLILLASAWAGRSTNMFYSLAGGGYHHHGGFLGGYHDFFRGNINNSQDSFSRRYENFQGEPLEEEKTHHIHKLRKPIIERIDPRLLIEIPSGRNSSTFFLDKLLNNHQ